MECQPGLRCRSPVVTGRVTTSATGEQIWEVIDGLIASGTGKATDFNFGRYIHRVHPNKSLLKFWRKGSVGVSRDWRKSLDNTSPLRHFSLADEERTTLALLSREAVDAESILEYLVTSRESNANIYYFPTTNRQ